MIQAFAFYLFATILVLSSIMVITARNPVHSVLFLILGFFNAAGLFILLGAEFVGMILVIVYVGAVAVLFLFVVMMLDIDFSTLRKGAVRYLPLGLLSGGLLLFELFTVYKVSNIEKAPQANHLATKSVELSTAGDSNTELIGQVLYTDYIAAFQLSGLILLVAMIGAIVLTHRVRPDTKRQKVSDQIARRPEEAMEIKKSATGIEV